MHWWGAWGRSIVSALASAGIGWCAFVADRPVPILDWFDLGIHEVGHLVAFPLPELLMFMAGSFAQIAFPAAMAAYFMWVRRDPASGGFCLAWAGTSAWDVAVYVADAPFQALPLVGGGRHDWAFILGHFDAVDQAGRVAGWIETTGAVMVLAGMAAALLSTALPLRQAAPSPVRRGSLPVREVRDHGEASPGSGGPGAGRLPAPPPGAVSGASPPDPSAGAWGPVELLPEDPFTVANAPEPSRTQP